MEQKDLIATDFSLEPIAIAHLKESGKWAKFLGVVGFVVSILFTIVAVFAGSKLAELNSYDSPYGYSRGLGMNATMIIIIYVVIAIVVFIISIFLYKFGKNVTAAITETSQSKLTTSFLNLKLYYRTIGIITIVYLVLVVLGIIAGIIFTATNRF